MKPETKRVLFVGFIKWLGVGVAALSGYMLKIGSLDAWNWFVVGTGALGHVSLGLGALGTFLAKPVEAPRPVRRSMKRLNPDPDFDSFTLDDPVGPIPVVVPSVLKSGPVTALMSSEHFSQAELECKGQTCDCVFPGMSPGVMAMLENLRQIFGPLIVNSAYRCPIHNTVVGGEDDSFHKEAPGRAVDVRSPTYSPREMYEYMDSKHPKQHGLGLYKNFIHIDDRDLTWARKIGPEHGWKEFKHATADAELA